MARRPPRRSLLRSLLAASLAALAPVARRPRLASGRARGGAATIVESVRVSRASPFSDGCAGASLRSRIYRGSAVEPMLAIDPRDPRHLVAGWVQDRIATAAACGLIGAVSRDGGATWTTTPMPFSRCGGGAPINGGDYRRASDPWITFAPGGALYYAALAVNAFAGPDTDSAILVSRSNDGGSSWSDPATVARTPFADGFNDKPTITADPTDERFAYVVWNRERPEEREPSKPGGAPLMFSRTTDGGQTWQQGREIYAAPDTGMIGPLLFVLPSGELVCIATRTVPADGGGVRRDIIALRSGDRGTVWTAPIVVSDVALARLRDPYSTFPIQLDPAFAVIPAAAMDPRDARRPAARGSQVSLTCTVLTSTCREIAASTLYVAGGGAGASGVPLSHPLCRESLTRESRRKAFSEARGFAILRVEEWPAGSAVRRRSGSRFPAPQRG